MKRTSPVAVPLKAAPSGLTLRRKGVGDTGAGGCLGNYFLVWCRVDVCRPQAHTFLRPMSEHAG